MILQHTWHQVTEKMSGDLDNSSSAFQGAALDDYFRKGVDTDRNTKLEIR